MYDFIKNPDTNRNVSIYTKKGQKILEKYIRLLNISGGDFLFTAEDYYCTNPNHTINHLRNPYPKEVADAYIVCEPDNRPKLMEKMYTSVKNRQYNINFLLNEYRSKSGKSYTINDLLAAGYEILGQYGLFKYATKEQLNEIDDTKFRISLSDPVFGKNLHAYSICNKVLWYTYSKKRSLLDNKTDKSTCPVKEEGHPAIKIDVKITKNNVKNYLIKEIKDASETSSYTAYIPSYIYEIEDEAFKDKKLYSIKFQSDAKLEKIGNGAFVNTKHVNPPEIHLGNIHNMLPSSLKIIGSKAFSGSGIKTIHFKTDVKYRKKDEGSQLSSFDDETDIKH